MGANEELSSKLSEEIELLGIKLWVLISISVGVFMTLILSVMSICLLVSRRRKKQQRCRGMEAVFQHVNTSKIPPTYISTDSHWSSSISTTGGDDLLIIIPPTIAAWDATCIQQQQHHQQQDSHLSWLTTKQGNPNQVLCHWFTLRDMQEATQGFSEAHILGHGGYGIVYKGQLPDGTLIAVKNLLMNDNNNNMSQVEREFHVELEVIKHARHENLVRFLGYCKEGTHRMLVYEYVDNGSLEQWLHSSPSIVLKWESRMKILHGTAKALAYMHEDLEPRVIHRDVKSSNILVDSRWNAKVSDFGLAKLLPTEKHHIETRVMGTFGYVAPEYANTGLLNERCDTYSFGVVVLETVTGRDPVDYARPPVEVNLVDWLNVMVSNHQLEEVVDPKLKEKPSLQELKKIVDIALKCVDQEAARRPKMSQVIQMLEYDDNVP